ncbi:protein kinase [Mesorhizobium sp. M0115]|uniref:protein kinase domain-containing protein n=1 Tax=unclassified Mesorhizobium TaxID=325217 RepID=UPI00333C2DD2
MAILFSGNGEVEPREFVEVDDQLVSFAGRHFEIAERIAAGGNGVVHRCIDIADGLEFAIKFQLDLRQRRRLRFAREQVLLSELKHDHLIVYEDHGNVAGRQKRRFGVAKDIDIPFLIMGLGSKTLSALVKAEEIPPEIFIAQFRGLAHALGRIHTRAFHRDIKPDNILVVGDRWVLSDYGLCDPHDCAEEERVTPDWEVVGPRFWMSPEANNRSIGRQDAINAASDVFQLASVFWFVVNRSHPTGVLSRLDWHGPDALFGPIFKALHHDASIRPADGRAFAAQIDTAILS